MTLIRWKSAVSDSFDNAADWNGGAVPGATDDASLTPGAGAAFTVTVTGSHTVNSIITGASATLSIAAGTFTATNGTGTGANTGVIAVGDGAALALGGAVNNRHGTISLSNTGDATTLSILAAGATFSGGGRITLSDSAVNTITGAAGAVLTNVDNTIAGAGQLGAGKLAIVNGAAGVIEATGETNALVVNTHGHTLINAGLIEATGLGGLVLSQTTVANAGKLEANGGSIFTLKSDTVIGGVLRASGKGRLRVGDSSVVLDGFDAGAMTLSGQLAIAGGASLTVQGELDLAGTAGKGKITFGSGATALIIGADDAEIAGGKIILGDNFGSQIEGVVTSPGGIPQVSTLTTSGTIDGAGTIGVNLSLINQGLIEARGVNALVLAAGAAQVAGGDTITNAGTLEAFNKTLGATGGLRIDDLVIANGATGVIEARGAASHVDLADAIIEGGTLKALSGGAINLGAGVVLDGSANAVTNAASLLVRTGDTLMLEGAIDNAGVIALGGGAAGAVLQAASAGVTLGGGGTIAMQGGKAYLSGAAIINRDNTIVGAGAITSLGALVNQARGVVNATGYLSLQGDVAVTNAGLMEATGGGALFLYGTINGASGGVILASDASRVALAGVVAGGTLTTSGSGVIESYGGALDGRAAAVTNAGELVDNGDTLTLEGSIINSGSISINPDFRQTTLEIGAAGVTLSGHGAVSLFANATYGAALAGGTLTNLDNTITVAGTLSGLALLNLGGLVNGALGVLDATGFLYLTKYQSFSNAGLLEATGGGFLKIYDTAASSKGGVILAADDSTVRLAGVTAGGTLATSGSGVIEGYRCVLDGSASAVTNAGRLVVLPTDTLGLNGLIDNTGTIVVEVPDTIGANPAYATVLEVGSAGVTLAGQGTVMMEQNGGYYSLAAGAALTNLGNTIIGAGALGSFKAGLAALDNQAQGVVDATGYLLVNASTMTNAGLMEATGGGQLDLGLGACSNSGMVAAIGGRVRASSVSNTGTLGAYSGGSVAVQSLTNTGLVEAASGGYLLVGTSMTNSGVLEAGVGGYVITQSSITNTGLLEADGGELLVSGPVSGSAGRAAILAEGILEFSSTFNQAVEFKGGTGELILARSQGYTASITGFSSKGASSLDLRDIGFVSAHEASFAGGVLTVSDGTHTARIQLAGLSKASFTCSSDGQGGVIVTGSSAQAPETTLAGFTQTAAAFAPGGDAVAWIPPAALAAPPPLARPTG